MQQDYDDKYDKLCLRIRRWRSRLKRAMTTIDKLERQKLRLDKKLTRQQVEAELKAAPPPKKAEPKPTVAELVTEHVEAMVAKGDGLDIPTALKRPPPPTPAERKARKAKMQAEQQKGIRAECKALDSIPKSKQRWDTTHSRWTSEA